MNPLPRCWAEISRAALESNYRRLRTLGPEVMAVVKADAYGHGVHLVAPELARLGARHFAVATVAEGVQLRCLPALQQAAIYIMAPVLPEEAAGVVQHALIPFASDIHLIEAIAGYASATGRTASVHIDVDTGIGRSGIAPGRLEELLRRVAAMGAVRVTGICTHFTAADSPDGGADVLAQQRFFESILRALQPELTTGLAVHAANSPGALRVHPGASSLIRPGLLLYGIAPSAQFEAAFEYEPVMTVRARALLVRELPAGSDISYNRTYRLPHDARVATIGIGYGDGYPRALSNSGQVIGPAGEVLPIRGRVCMDQLCVELPQECTMESGATVTVLGASAGRSITAAGIAQITGAAPHEMTTCLMPRVPRVWIGD